MEQGSDQTPLAQSDGPEALRLNGAAGDGSSKLTIAGTSSDEGPSIVRGIWGPRTASMIYWCFAAVGVGSLPVIIGLAWLILHYDYRIATFLGRGDLLFLATVLAAGGLAQVVAARECPALDDRTGLKALLVCMTGFIAIVGAILYTFAFIADWTRADHFDYELIARASMVILASTILIAGCCTYTTQS